jgi:hypothetical protein
MNRIALLARLKPGAQEQASGLLEQGPPFDPAERGLARHVVYLSAGEIVFVFEGDEVEWIVEAQLPTPTSATRMGLMRETLSPLTRTETPPTLKSIGLGLR